MVAVEKINASLLAGTIGFSFLLHLILWISIMNIEIPKETTRADFEAWVKEITPRKREAIILEKVPAVQKQAEKQAVEPKEVKEIPEAKNTLAIKTGVSKTAPSQARVKALRSAGILGLIGVASQGSSGSKSAMADVFSSDSAKVSDDLGAVMEGKKHAELASHSNISRRTLGADSEGPADTDKIQHVSSGKIISGQRQESAIPVPKVHNVASGVVSGTADSSLVLGIIARKNSSFTRCYERALKNNPELAGKIAYELSVSSEGQVIDARFIEDTLRVKEVADCIKGILMRLVFPAPQGGAAIFSSVLVFGTH